MEKEVLGEFVSINPAVSDMAMGDSAIDNSEAFKTFHGGLKLAKMAKKILFLTEIQQIDIRGG